jgi:hypothetical protein
VPSLHDVTVMRADPPPPGEGGTEFASLAVMFPLP